MEKLRFDSTNCYPQHWLQFTGQLYATADLSPRKEHAFGGWYVPKTARTLWSRRKIVTARNRSFRMKNAFCGVSCNK